MTDLERLAELAMCVEGLTGPDRGTDLDIACALDLRPEWLAKSVGGHMWVDSSGRHPVIRWADECMGESTGNPSVDDPLKFTASLDAAMKLVPEGVSIGLHIDHNGIDCAWSSRAAGWQPHVIPANSPALALCAASLRALAAKSREVG